MIDGSLEYAGYGCLAAVQVNICEREWIHMRKKGRAHPTKVGSSVSPLVSVAITAFNHEKLLARAIESALDQTRDFPLEIVIGEDCSKDSTAAVADSYRERFPGIIRLHHRATNLGIQRNTFQTFQECRGEFIAWLDGDDHWTDPNKLTVQVKALQNDPTVMVCGHYVRWIDVDGKVSRARYPDMPPGRYGLEHILHRNFLPTPSVMFRNGIQQDLPDWYLDRSCPLSDWPLWILAAERGDILLLDGVMADYFLAPSSDFTSKGLLHWYVSDIRFYELIESILPENLRGLARSEQGHRYESITRRLCDAGDFVSARRTALKAVWVPRLVDNLSSKLRLIVSGCKSDFLWQYQKAHGSPKEAGR